jgi:HlyD family secretion protein
VSAELRVVPIPAPAAPTHGAVLTPARGRRFRRRLVLLVLIIAAAAAGLLQWRRASTSATAVPHYVTASATIGDVIRTVTASGSVNPVTTIQVGTYVSGVIQDISCDYNTIVRKGQLCAKIDPRPYASVVEEDRANLANAKAQLAKDQTNLGYAKLTYERTVGLREQGIVSQDAFDSAKSAYDQAMSQIELDKSTIDQREAALHAAEINLAYTDIVSPVDGTVISRNVTMGQTVAASFQTPTLFLIATDLTLMQVDANVSESDIGGIKVGNAATFTVEAFPKRVFEGRVTEVRQAPQTVQNVVTYDVVISVPNRDLVLKPGMTATVRIVVDHRERVLRVPGTALRYTPGGVANAARGTAGSAQVWVLRDGRAHAIPVKVGLDDETNVEIVAGEVKAGDEVVTGEQPAAAPGQNRPSLFRL